MSSDIDKPVAEVLLGQEPNLVTYGEGSHGDSELVVVTEYGATNPGSLH